MSVFPQRANMQTQADGEVAMSPTLRRIKFTATLAEINAGKVIAPKMAGFHYMPVGFYFVPNGAGAAATDVRISTTDGTPVDVATIPTASVTSGAKISQHLAAAVLGAGWLAEGNENQGLQIRKTGSDMTTLTSVTGYVDVEVHNA